MPPDGVLHVPGWPIFHPLIWLLIVLSVVVVLPALFDSLHGRKQ